MRVKWLKEGDKNTKFFHWVANGRRCTNFINELCMDGVKSSDPSLIREGIFSHFKDHFKNVTWKRPKLLGLQLKCLSVEERERVLRFSLV